MGVGVPVEADGNGTVTCRPGPEHRPCRIDSGGRWSDSPAWSRRSLRSGPPGSPRPRSGTAGPTPCSYRPPGARTRDRPRRQCRALNEVVFTLAETVSECQKAPAFSAPATRCARVACLRRRGSLRTRPLSAPPEAGRSARIGGAERGVVGAVRRLLGRATLSRWLAPGRRPTQGPQRSEDRSEAPDWSQPGLSGCLPSLSIN